jgi:hypothetical protein
MQIFARHELTTMASDNGHPRLLLEGSWPAAAADAKKNKLLALDDLFDGRHAAIDAEAERLAERIAAAVRRPCPDQPSFADVNILKLRYAAVKWLRPLAWRRSLSPAMRPQHYELHVSTDGEDAEYSALWQALAAADGCDLQTKLRRREPTPRWLRSKTPCGGDGSLAGPNHFDSYGLRATRRRACCSAAILACSIRCVRSSCDAASPRLGSTTASPSKAGSVGAYAASRRSLATKPDRRYLQQARRNLANRFVTIAST